jgi:hypothetical protein
MNLVLKVSASQHLRVRQPRRTLAANFCSGSNRQSPRKYFSPQRTRKNPKVVFAGINAPRRAGADMIFGKDRVMNAILAISAALPLQTPFSLLRIMKKVRLAPRLLFTWTESRSVVHAAHAAPARHRLAFLLR